MIVRFDDLSAPELAPFACLTGRQLLNRDIFIAESENVILSALEAGVEPVSLLCEERHICGKAASLIQKLGDTPVYTAPDEVLASLTGYALSRGMLCAMKRPKMPDAAEILGKIALNKAKCRVAVLDNVLDAENIGAIIRSAAALGADGVFMTPDCTDALSRRAARVSMGAVFRVPVCSIPKLENGGAQLLRHFGFTVCALALDRRSENIRDINASRLALVLGNEGRGLSSETLAACDKTAIIPMHAGTDSLNVAAAAAVALWEFCRPE